MPFKTPTVRHRFFNLAAVVASQAKLELGELVGARHISSLKVAWRKDQKLDQAIEDDKRYKLCARVVKEVLNEPNHAIPIRYLEKRRQRLRLGVRAKTFLAQNPTLFHVYLDRIKPKTEPVPFARPSARLRSFLDEERRIYAENEGFIVSKLCKLLMMSKDRVLSAEKLAHVKRDFGFPDDFLTNLVPKHPEYFRFAGEEKSFLELVSWNPNFARSAIELRAEEESRSTGIGMRPNFQYKLPPGWVLKKEMREWVRDWLEREYVSPYEDARCLEQASPEREKRSVGVFHELLSLSVQKRIAVPILGKLGEEFLFSNAFETAFTRHSGIFYLSLKGGIKTAMLREAYDGHRIVHRDPLLEIKDRFVELMEEGWQERKHRFRLQREESKKGVKLLAMEAQQSS